MPLADPVNVMKCDESVELFGTGLILVALVELIDVSALVALPLNVVAVTVFVDGL